MVRRDYRQFDIIALALILARVESYTNLVRDEIIELLLDNNEYLRDQMRSEITRQQQLEWLQYQDHIKRVVGKQFSDYNHKVNVSLYYTNDTTYGIIISEMGDRFFKKDSKTVRGLGGQIMKTYRTEYTRTTSMLTHWDSVNLGLEKEWVYTYESKQARTHHHAHDGVVSKDGWFIVNGKRTQAPGLFGDPSEDINCRCRVRLVDEP